MPTPLKELIDSLVADFKRLDSKYGNDWTEWQDVRDAIAALQQFIPAQRNQPVYSKFNIEGCMSGRIQTSEPNFTEVERRAQHDHLPEGSY